MEVGDLVKFSPNDRLGSLSYVKYCTRIQNQIGDHQVGIILSITDKSFLVLFGLKSIVLHQSFLEKTDL